MGALTLEWSIGSKMEEKRFNEWNEEKKVLHGKDGLRTVNEGEIWWCAVGENIGVEINGKGKNFVRPVLVLRKLSRFGFIGIPLTSQYHEGTWYAHFRFKDRDEYAVFAQMRNISVKRLWRKMGEVDDRDMILIRRGLIAFLGE